jgi:ribosomal 50S subunit-recycling heat shock protein
VRLDKYLKISRIIKRRTVANEAASLGRISVNGKTAKPASEVKEGDTLDILMGGKHMLVKIVSIQEHAAKADASSMYEIISNG